MVSSFEQWFGKTVVLRTDNWGNTRTALRNYHCGVWRCCSISHYRGMGNRCV
jgi:hypothetical protein